MSSEPKNTACVYLTPNVAVKLNEIPYTVSHRIPETLGASSEFSCRISRLYNWTSTSR